MGSLTEDPKQGQIYLQREVSGEFEKVLATSKHSSIDTFLEHLIDLYTEASKSTHCVRVRNDVAQRFTALQCETRFQTSDDLMKHLLNLHVEYLKTASNNNSKDTRERSVPRKSRKSQPKRNIKHTAVLDSEDSGDHLRGDISEDPWREVSVSSVEESETERSEVDLSRVKQEVIDVDEISNKHSDKATIFKRVFHKHESPTSLKYTIKAKGSRKNSGHVIVKSPPQASIEKVTTEPEVTTSNVGLSPLNNQLSPLNTHPNQYSDSFGGGNRKTEDDIKRTETGKAKNKTNMAKVDNDPEVIGFDTDYGSLFEETRLACVNVENVEGHKFEFFSGDDALSSLIAETNENYQGIDEIRKITINNEDKLKRSTKPVQNTNVRYNYDCFRCGKKFKNRAPLNLHIASEHNEDGGLGLICVECGKQVDYDHELKLHKKFFCKKVKKSFQCLVCKLYFISLAEKDGHPCSKDPSKPYYCSVKDCQSVSRNVKDLTEHVTRHLGIKPFLCNICGKAFSAKKDMDRHSDTHKESNDYYCKICGNSFKSYHTMRRHVFAHKFKDQFKCDKCSYTTALKTSFTQHMIRHRQREHKCKICAKSLRSARSLSKHIQNRHTFNRIFTCRYCDFTTDVGLSYSSHMRSHKGRKHLALNFTSKAAQNKMALALGDMEETGNEYEVITSENDLNIPQIHHTNATFTSSSPLVKFISNAPMLADAAILDQVDLNISGQNADSIMADIVESSDASEISVIPPGGTNANLVLYTMDVPSSSLNVTNFMSDTITAVSVPETWPGREVN